MVTLPLLFYLQALYFDLRKGAHSIGSNVRDAAAYVLWALARTQNKSALVPHAEELAQRLTAVALFDREVHIRRAASAAFQEHVGRTVSLNLCHPLLEGSVVSPYEDLWHRVCFRMASTCWGKQTFM